MVGFIESNKIRLKLQEEILLEASVTNGVIVVSVLIIDPITGDWVTVGLASQLSFITTLLV